MEQKFLSPKELGNFLPHQKQGTLGTDLDFFRILCIVRLLDCGLHACYPFQEAFLGTEEKRSFDIVSDEKQAIRGFAAFKTAFHALFLF